MVRKSGRPSQRGGRRLGQQGQSYANRTDLNQPVRTATGQPYGEAGRQAAAQHAIPLPAQGHGMGAGAASMAPPPAPREGRTSYTIAGMGGLTPDIGPGGMGTNAITPGGHGPIDAPTNRPGEPLTAGLQGGAGPGPEAIQAPPNNTLNTLRGIYAAHPSPDLLALIQEAQGHR